MVRRMLLRIVNICLILLLFVACSWMYEQYHTVHQKWGSDETAQTTAELSTDPASEDKRPSTDESQAAPATLPANQITNPGYRMNGNLLLTQDRGKIFLVNLESGTVQQVYAIERPWYLISYDLAPDGTVALVLEKSEGAKGTIGYRNQIQLLLIHPQAPDRPLVLESASTYGPDLYEIQTVRFSPNGKYVLVDDSGFGWDRFKVYWVQRSPWAVHLVTDMASDGSQYWKAIGFDRTSAMVYCRRRGETTALYEYHLGKKSWRRLFTDQEILQDVIEAGGEIYSLQPDRTHPSDIQLVRITP